MIAAVLIYCAVSMVATVIVYNNIFTRYDDVTTVPPQLQAMVDKRQTHSFSGRDGTLSGYLYSADETVKRQSLVVIAPGFQASADSYLWQISALLEYGWSVFICDPTGSCSSQGDSAVGFKRSSSHASTSIRRMDSMFPSGKPFAFSIAAESSCCTRAVYACSACKSFR